MGRYLELAAAVARDRWGRRAAALLSGVADDELRAGLRDLFEERAAIVEHDGGLPRERAEELAYNELDAAVAAVHRNRSELKENR